MSEGVCVCVCLIFCWVSATVLCNMLRLMRLQSTELVRSLLHWRIQVWADRAPPLPLTKTRGRSWPREVVYLRHEAKLSFKSLNFTIFWPIFCMKIDKKSFSSARWPCPLVNAASAAGLLINVNKIMNLFGCFYSSLL